MMTPAPSAAHARPCPNVFVECPIGGCRAKVPTHFVLCLNHLRFVPANLEEVLRAAWLQIETAPSDQRRRRAIECWWDARAAAILAVADAIMPPTLMAGMLAAP